MFTGIITDIGTIAAVEERGDARVRIACGYDPATIDLGASIACSGVCLTVVDKGTDAGGHWFAVDVSGETRSRTAQGQWTDGRQLNLERACRVGDELGGHIVTGHIDGIAEVVELRADGDSKRVEFRIERALAPFVAPKGSITVDGVSLTVNEVRDEGEATCVAVNIIPHTQQVTTLARLEPGRAVNIEIDVLARYLQRMEAYRARRA